MVLRQCMLSVVFVTPDQAHCDMCGDDGFYLDHSDACYSKGECVNGDRCPVQRQCECEET